MVLCTSPGNFQAWVAVKVRRRISPGDSQGAGADPSASGATRISGSLNFKTKYAPAFPAVEISQANPAKSRPPPNWKAPDLWHQQRKPPAVFLIVFLRPQGREGPEVAELCAMRPDRAQLSTIGDRPDGAESISHGA